MPLETIIHCPEYHLALWDIRETTEELENDLHPTALQSFAKGTRNFHWLSSRRLMQAMLDNADDIEILKTGEGKPFLAGRSEKISLSHSGTYAAAIISQYGETGVDIEKISDRILRIAHKFVNEREREMVGDESDLKTLYLIWSAKEVLFKYHGFGALDFRKHLHLSDLNWQMETLHGVIHKEDFREEIPLRFRILGEYICTWVDHERI